SPPALRRYPERVRVLPSPTTRSSTSASAVSAGIAPVSAAAGGTVARREASGTRPPAQFPAVPQSVDTAPDQSGSPGGGAVTVTEIVPVRGPSVAVIVALPAPTPLSGPEASTVATVVSDGVHSRAGPGTRAPTPSRTTAVTTL